MKKFLLRMNLQNFADGDGLIDMDDNDAELTDDDYTLDSDDDDQTGPEYGDPEPEPEAKEPEPAPEPEPEPEKKVQTPEENAKFAEERRQRQLREQLEQSSEFKLAKQLADLYGTTPEVMLQQVQQAALQREAEKSGVSVEYLQRQKEQDAKIQQLEQQLYQSQFDSWQRRVDSEASTIQKDFPMLSQEDIDAAKVHLLQVLQNPDAPLEDAVYALHGKKIIQASRDLAKQEALAEISGRKASPVTPGTGSKSSTADGLTAEERAMARNMGISEADYLKYKM
jgi:phage I-like protein